MPPDDLPIDQETEDSTKLPGTKPLMRRTGRSAVGAEAEVRGGAERPDDPPLEQQLRRERTSR